MAPVALAVPLLTGGSSLVAGASALTIGSTAITFGQLSAGASLVSGLFSGIQASSQARAAGSAERQASQSRARELEFQMQSERTNEAVQDAERQRNLRRILASQRAAGAGIVDESGNILNLQTQTITESDRQKNAQGFQTDMAIGQLNLNKLSTIRAGENAFLAGKSKARTSLISTGITAATQGASLYGTFQPSSTYTSPKTGEVVTWNR